MTGVIVDVDAKTAEAERNLAAVNKSLMSIDASAKTASSTIANAFKGIAATVASGGMLISLKNITSEFTNLSNRIATVTGRTQELVVVQDKLFDIAFETNATLKTTVEAYAGIGRAVKTMGVSQERTLIVTKAIQQALAAGGGSAESAAAAVFQLNQGLSAGALRGEELNSVMEQAPRLAQAIADELKATTGQMRLLAAEGKLTSSVVFNALVNQSKQINEEFKALTPTLNQAFSKSNDAMKLYVSELDRGLGLSAGMGRTISTWANQIKDASKNAFELGANLRYTFFSVKGIISEVAGPMASILKNIGQQLMLALPTGFLTRTLKGDINEAIRELDKGFLGGIIGKMRSFSFVNLFTVRTDVEKAIFELKRLSPQYWAASGWDIPTFKQFFSRENLQKYSSAFANLATAIKGNTDGIGTYIDTMRIKVDFAMKAISRYFGFRMDTLFTFESGQMQTFIFTLSEMVRGVSGAAIKFYELSKIMKNSVLTAEDALADSLVDAFRTIPSFITSAASATISAVSSLARGAYQILKDLKPTIDIEALFTKPKALIEDFFEALDSNALLNRSLSAIKAFSAAVIYEFFLIYDKVIGHSWWTDTVETVVHTSQTLWDRSSSGLKKFGNNTVEMFKSVFDSSSRLDFSKLLDFQNFSFSTDKFKMPKLDVGNFADNLVEISAKLKETFVGFFESFPDMMKFALSGVYAILVAAFFPASLLKKVLIIDALAMMATSGTLIAEQFGRTLTGGSFAATVGENFGKVIGAFVASFIKEVPKLLNVVFGFGAAFVKGFLSQLPILGGALTSFFAGFQSVGLSGPLGLLAAGFLGSKAIKGLEGIGALGKAFDPILKSLTAMKTFFFGATDTKTGGYVASQLFGSLGPARTAGGLILILDYLGVFNSIFANSPLAHMAAQGGAIFLALAGQRGFEAAMTGLQLKLGTFMIKVQDVLRSMNLGGVWTQLFPGAQDISRFDSFSQRFGSVISGVVTSISSKVMDVATPVLSKGYDFLKVLFLGTDPEGTVAGVKKLFTNVVDHASGQIAKLRAFFSGLDLFSSIKGAGAGGTGMFGNLFASVSNFFSNLRGPMSQAQGLAEKIGGENGLVGRALFGKVGRAVLIAGLLTAISVAAFAKAPASPGDTIAPPTKSLGDNILESWNKLITENPFVQVAVAFTAAMTIGLITAAVVFRRKLLEAVAEVGVVQTAIASARNGTGLVGAIGRGRGAIAATAIGVGAGVAQGYNSGSAIDGAVLGLTVAGLAYQIRGLLAKAFSFTMVAGLVTSLVKLIISPIGLGILGTFTLGISLKNFIFGKTGGGWKEFIDGVLTDLRKIGNFATAGFFFNEKTPGSSKTRLSDDTTNFAKQQNLDANYDVSKINTEKLNDKQKEKLDAKIKEFDELLIAAREEKDLRGGSVSDDTRRAIRAKNDALKNYADNLTAKTALDRKDLLKGVTDSRNNVPENRSQTFFLNLEQSNSDFLVAIERAINKTRRALPFASNSTKADATANLEQLDKDVAARKYDVRYRGEPTEADRYNSKLIREAQGAQFTDKDIEAQINTAFQAYTQALTKLAREETDFVTGRFTPVSNKNPLKQDANNKRDVFTGKLETAATFNLQSIQIAKFNNQLSELDSALRSVGIEFATNKLFAGSEGSFNRLITMGAEVKKLGEQLLRTKDIAERNKIIVRIEEIKTKTEIENKEAQKQSRANPSFTIPEAAQSLNLPALSPDTLQRIPDGLRQQLYNTVNDVQQLDIRRKVRPPEKFEQSVAGTDFEKIKNFDPKTPEGLANATALTNARLQHRLDLQEFKRAETQFNVKKAEAARFMDQLGKQYGGLNYAADAAQNNGVDLGNLARGRGAKGAVESLSKLNQLGAARDAAKDTDPEKFGKLDQRFKFLQEDLSRLPVTLQESIGLLSGLGNAFTLEDIGGFTTTTLAMANKAIAMAKSIEITMQRAQGAISDAQLDEILDKKFAAAELSFRAFLTTISNTPEKISQILSKVGIVDIGQIKQVPADILKTIFGLDELQRELDFMGTQTKFRNQWAEIATLSAKIADSRNAIKDIATIDIGQRNQRVSSTLDTGLGDKEIVSFGKPLFDLLDRYAVNLKNKVFLAQRDGNFDGLKKAFDDIDSVVKQTSFLKTFSDFNKRLKDATNLGIRSQFDAITAAIKDFPIDERSFQGINPAERTKLTKDAIAFETLNKILTEGPQSVDLQKKAAESLEAGKPVQDVVTELLETLKTGLFANDPGTKVFVDGLTPPLVANTTAVGSLTNAINALIAKIPGVSFLGEGKANGGWINGPGTSRSDSVMTPLSNGEFVVNAMSAAKNRQLLEHINGYADGGEIDKYTNLSGYVTPTGHNFLYDILSNKLSYERVEDTSVGGTLWEIVNMFKKHTPFEDELQKSSDQKWWSLADPVRNRRDALKKLREEEEVNYRKYGSSRKPYATGGAVWGAGTSTSDSIPAMLSNGEYVVNAKATSKYRDVLNKINYGITGFADGGLVGVSATAGEDYSLRIVKALENLATSMVARGLNGIDPVNRVANQARGLNLDLDPTRLYTLNAEGFKQLSEAMDAAYNAQTELNKATRDRVATPEQLRAADVTRNAVESILDNIPKYSNKLLDASREFTGAISSGTLSAFQDLFKGKATPKEFIKNILGTFTNSIVDAFMKGLLDPFTGTDGVVTKMMKELGEGLFKTGGGISTGVNGGIFGGLFKGGGGSNFTDLDAIASMGGGGGSWWASLASAFGFADGGYVRGPGTSISDSIPAYISNGEFIVNAKATSENLGLLHNINSGRLKKFAAGGLVDTSMVATPTMTDAKPTSAMMKSKGSDTIVNLTITGDISRQTRSEIYGMLPSIAEGVNSHNREKGYRG